jgi:hypothetical protein
MAYMFCYDLIEPERLIFLLMTSLFCFLYVIVTHGVNFAQFDRNV